MEELNAWIFDEIWLKDKNFRDNYDNYIDMIKDVQGYPTVWNKWVKNFEKSKRPQKKIYMWLTMSPDKIHRNIDNTPENVKAVADWCNKWFKYANHYGDYAWVVECGSQGDHIHAHAIVEMKNSDKHADNLKKSWNKHFPKHQLLTSVDANTKAYKNGTKRGEYCYKKIDKWEYVQERLDYLENEKKGTHENLVDLGFRDSRGFLTDNS